MSLPPSTITGGTYRLRWGSWNKALKKFVDEVNKDLSETVILEKKKENTKSEEVSTVKKTSAEQHFIKIGLRYDILKRDLFRCVLCGRRPSNRFKL
jgi:hypothetical protein